jgi:hypothetical protein
VYYRKDSSSENNEDGDPGGNSNVGTKEQQGRGLPPEL